MHVLDLCKNYFTEGSSAYNLSHGSVQGVVPEMKSNGKSHSGVAARVNHGQTVSRSYRERFLAQNMFARRRGSNNLFLVNMVGRANEDGIDALIIEQLVKRVVHRWATMFRRKLPAANSIAAEDRYQPASFGFAHCGRDKTLRVPPGANQAPAEFFLSRHLH